jgi:hypothetical protein
MVKRARKGCCSLPDLHHFLAQNNVFIEFGSLQKQAIARNIRYLNYELRKVNV